MLIPKVGDRVWSLRVDSGSIDWKFVVSRVFLGDGYVSLTMDPQPANKPEYNIYPGWSFIWTTHLQRMIRDRY